MMHETAWTPSEAQRTGANIARFMANHGLQSYEELRTAWTMDPAWFWGTVADEFEIHWFEHPHATLDLSEGIAWARWFPGGTTNIVSSCVDKHDPRLLAYVWEGEEGTVTRMTFGELSLLVSRIAGQLRAMGVEKGDRVGLYLPLMPEAYACIYACAKLGAVAVPMFSGFGAPAIAARLQDAGARVLITADSFLRRGKVIPMQQIAEEAAHASGVGHILVYPRLGANTRDSILVADPVYEAEPVPSDHPYLIAYTSGTTGKPKGAVHTHAGLPLKAATETFFHCDQREGELLCWLTDLGWIMAPLTMAGAGLTGRPLFLYDGAPDHPGRERVRQLIDRHEVAILGTSPTYIRALMGQSDHGFDTSPASLRILCSTGEAWNEAPWWWYFQRVGGGRCPVVNVAGGTEAGSFLGVLPIRPLKPCSFNSACVGVDAAVLRADGSEAGPDEVGELVVRQAWPGMTKSFWQDDERYLETYWSRWPDVWVHGDWASRDAAGDWWLHGRSDDTMMIAGKRVGPAEVESALVMHDDVIEAAAIGVPDELKGESIWCFVVLQHDRSTDEDALRSFVGTQLGKAFTPLRVIAVSRLPRTRNGKILRRAIRAVVVGESQGDLSSLDDPDSISEIQTVMSRLICTREEMRWE